MLLQGLRVVELGQVFAGPFAGAIFADLGASVVKVERPEGGDDARQMGELTDSGSALPFHIFNRGKQSVSIDLHSPQGLKQLHDLLAEADIVLHNLRPGVAEQLGLDGTTLTARYPRLIYCEISAFGHVGPARLQPGYEPLMQAYSGLSSSNGGPDDPPMRMGASLCDQGSGMWLVIGALTLLHERNATGKGGIVNNSLLETALAWNAQKSDAWINQGKLPVRDRSGHPGFVPYQAFAAKDGALVICCGNDRLYYKFCDVLEKPEWKTDARFITNQMRLKNKAALIELIEQALAHNTRAAWVQAFTEVGVPASAIHSVPEAMEQAQVQALGILQTVPNSALKLTGIPLSFNGERPQIKSDAPRLASKT